jgi:ArsR family transcriptional regulator
MEALQTPQSTISRHLSFLKNAGWVTSKRSGKWMHYQLRSEAASLQHLIASVLVEKIPQHPTCREDDERYQSYLATKPKNTCD